MDHAAELGPSPHHVFEWCRDKRHRREHQSDEELYCIHHQLTLGRECQHHLYRLTYRGGGVADQRSDERAKCEPELYPATPILIIVC